MSAIRSKSELPWCSLTQVSICFNASFLTVSCVDRSLTSRVRAEVKALPLISR